MSGRWHARSLARAAPARNSPASHSGNGTSSDLAAALGPWMPSRAAPRAPRAAAPRPWSRERTEPNASGAPQQQRLPGGPTQVQSS
eukprot:15442032-Alexandrium_andersonii.AAC.1